MELKYFKMCYSRNGNNVKLLNPTIIYCNDKLAKAYGKAITKCNQLEGGKEMFSHLKKFLKKQQWN